MGSNKQFVLFFVILTLVANYSHAAEQQILCYGDSITYGGQWVKALDADPTVRAINAGRSGRRTSQAVEELPPYLAKHRDLDKIILFLGVNDLPGRDKRPADEKVAQCVRDMSQAIDIARKHVKHASDVILIAPCDVNPETMNKLVLSKGYQITSPILKQLEKAYQKLAAEKDASFISLYHVVSKENFRDGLHPNDAGDVEISQAMLTFLKGEVAPVVVDTAVNGYPAGVTVVRYQSAIDQTQQPTLLYAAESEEKRPLLVGLHTWSSDYKSPGGDAVYARWCIDNDWHFVHPNFRGPNWTTQAMGSDAAVSDIVSVVEYMKQNYAVDENRIYLIGVSGGAYASLLMAGRHPEIWAGVSAWCPITDIGTWWEQTLSGKFSNYARHIEKSIGGRPDQNKSTAQECVKRSANTYLNQAGSVNLDINHGVHDGRQGSVPFSHSLIAFNQVAAPADQIAPKLIEAYYTSQKLPVGFGTANHDPLYGNKDVLFRKESNNARVTIFNGKHEIIQYAALNWLAHQRKGKPAQWELSTVRDLKTRGDESESGK